MKLIYEWGIPSVGFLIWIVLTFSIVPAFTGRLRKRSDQTQRALDTDRSLNGERPGSLRSLLRIYRKGLPRLRNTVSLPAKYRDLLIYLL
jgi:hypothetical protein